MSIDRPSAGWTVDGTWNPTKPERQWLAQRRHEAERAAAAEERRPVRSASAKLRAACDRFSVESGWVALGLSTATAAIPPGPGKQAGRRPPSHANPTATAFWATLNAIDTATVSWAHLAGPCNTCTSCPDSISDVGELLAIQLDTTPIMDDLLGTPPTAPGFIDAVNAAATWHSTAAADVAGAWHDAYQAGAEPDRLEQAADLTDRLSRTMRWLAGTLAHWTFRRERRCKEGCGGHAPSGAGATCVRCRKRLQRQRQEAS